MEGLIVAVSGSCRMGGLITLVVMEVVLGIDCLIFI